MDPYIGITDFMTWSQVQAMLRVFQRELPLGSPYQLHVGVMMSRKSLRGLPTKWAGAFPAKENIADIFNSSVAYNCLHYADGSKVADSNLDDHLIAAIDYGGPGINALQLDLAWPDPAQVARALRQSYQRIEVVLQIGQRAFDEVRGDIPEVLRRLEAYDGIIRRVLLDKSMGRGLGMDAVGLLPVARAIRKRFPTLGIGAAGGLGPSTMHLIEPLAKEFSDLSIDAQGRLRPSGSALDPIDWTLAEQYLTSALQLLG